MSIPIQLLQRADRLLGLPASLCLQPLRWARALRAQGDESVDQQAERVLIVKFWGLGSLQLMTPAVRSLRARHPQARIELLTLATNASFARRLRIFDDVRVLDVGGAGWAKLGARILAAILRVRRARFDVVYDFEFFTRFSAVLSVLSGAPRTYGFASPERSRAGLHTHTAPFNRYWHVARNFRSLAGGENGHTVELDELTPMHVDERDRLEATTLLFEHGLCEDGPLVVLNPNAGALSLERRWPTQNFAQLARDLIQEEDARVVVVGSLGEAERARDVVQRAGRLPHGRLVSLAGQLTIGGLGALLDEAAVFVTNDSGPMHLAAALGVPTIGLFGPETPVLYRPLGSRARWIYSPPACSPCINVHENKLARCVRGHAECMTNIAPTQVHTIVREEIEHPRRRDQVEWLPTNG